MCSKRGMLASEAAVILILGFIVLGTFISILVFFPLDTISEINCKVSIIIADKVNPLIPDLLFNVPVICYTKDIVSDKSDVEDVNFEIADHMRKCWNMWGAGEKNPEDKNIFTDDEFKCFKCYRLSFPELERPIAIEELNNFLSDPDNSVRGYKDSYANYFDNNILYGVGSINEDEKYGVVFVEHIEKARVERYIAAASVSGVTFGGACMFVVGVGWIASPACVAAGGAIGLGAAGVEQLIDYFTEEDRDTIMLSKFDDARRCGGYII